VMTIVVKCACVSPPGNGGVYPAIVTRKSFVKKSIP